MASKFRPLAPHLTGPTFRTNLLTSVIFRGTGVVMSVGLAALSTAYLPASSPVADYVWRLQQYPILTGLVKFGVAMPVTYHLLGGLRHLAWDNVIGQSPTFVHRTGMAAMAISGIVGVLAAFREVEPERPLVADDGTTAPSSATAADAAEAILQSTQKDA